jgi:hypothetical protein
MARCQLNLMPGKSDDDTKLVLACGKSNNCERFKTRGLNFDPYSFAYSVDPDFDADIWLADVEGRRRPSGALGTVQDVVQAVQSGYSETRPLVECLMRDCSLSKRTAENLIQKTSERGGIVRIARGRWTLGRKAEKLLESGG